MDWRLQAIFHEEEDSSTTGEPALFSLEKPPSSVRTRHVPVLQAAIFVVLSGSILFLSWLQNFQGSVYSGFATVSSGMRSSAPPAASSGSKRDAPCPGACPPPKCPRANLGARSVWTSPSGHGSGICICSPPPLPPSQGSAEGGAEELPLTHGTPPLGARIWMPTATAGAAAACVRGVIAASQVLVVLADVAMPTAAAPALPLPNKLAVLQISLPAGASGGVAPPWRTFMDDVASRR